VDSFDADTLADLKYRAKKQLRLRLRGLRAAYPEGLLAQASERIVASVLALPRSSTCPSADTVVGALNGNHVKRCALFAV